MERDPSPEYRLLGETIDFWHKRAVAGPFDANHDALEVVPCSRYGRTASDCAWYCVGALIAYDEAAGVENEVDAAMTLDHLMSLAVNDHPDVALLIMQSWDVLPKQLREMYGSIKDVGELAE